MPSKNKAPIAAEFMNPALGDARLNVRLGKLVEDIAKAPSKSFPRIFRTDAKIEAAYRFFSNPTVSFEALLGPHVDATKRRVADANRIRVLHDTTRFSFSGDREGLATLTKESRGFFAHFALAIGATELREPLGALAVRPYVHDEEELKARRKMSPSEKETSWVKRPRSAKARHRWESTALAVSEALPSGVSAIHVMDQEADDFCVFHSLLEAGVAFVIRGASTRLTTDGASIGELLETIPHEAFRTVRLNRRSKTRKHLKHPPREERDAELRIRFAPLSLRRPQNLKGVIDATAIPLYAVHVFEPNPPPEEDPIEWLLLTSERVSSLEDALTIVDHYRARWLIEEFFKALKTGCSFEKRQLETYDGLLRLLAVLVPIAWQLLHIRHLARQPQPPVADRVFEPERIAILRFILEEGEHRFRLPANPTARDILYGIASIGGHLPRNGEPGWLVIGRGYEDFLLAEQGWRAARGNTKK